MKLYNHLRETDQPNTLYTQFLSTEAEPVISLVDNNLPAMQQHCGQMGGRYPLSPSQREAVNHFNAMQDGEILAVNGPPGTGKTTLLQSVVADLYVKRAIGREKPPLIVAASTNNQAVTNIIDSFGKIETVGQKAIIIPIREANFLLPMSIMRRISRDRPSGCCKIAMTILQRIIRISKPVKTSCTKSCCLLKKVKTRCWHWRSGLPAMV